MDARDSGTGQADAAPHATVPPTAPVQPTVSCLSRVSRLTAVRVPPPVLQGLLAFAIYLAVFVAVYARPVFQHLDTPNLMQYWTDPNFYTWSLRWWPYAVSHGINPLFSSQIGAPHGYNLAWASTVPSVGLLMWPVTGAFGILVSYNVVLLLVPPVSGWAMFVAARRLTRRFWASLLAGAAYGFCPYELVHNWQGQPNLTVIALLPLMVYLVLLWWDGALNNTGFAIWMALAMALEFYTFSEAFFDMTLAWAGGLVIGFAVAGRAAWRKVARLAGLAAIAFAGAIAAAAPYLYYSLKHNQTMTVTRQNSEFSLHLVRMVLPWTDKLPRMSPLVRYSYSLGRQGLDDYIGFPLIFVLLALAAFAWRNKVSRLLLIVFVFVVALAVGPVLFVGGTATFQLPWAGLWSLPFVRSAEPSRFIVFAVLVLALALALWLAIPAKGTAMSRLRQAARWGLGVLAVAAILLDSPTALQAANPNQPYYQAPTTMHAVNQLPSFLTDGLYRRYLKPGEIVVIVTRRGNAGMLFQADADFYFRIAGGFINASLTPQDALPHPITLAADPSKVADQTLEDYIRSSGVGAIIVEQAWELPWMSNFSREFHMHGTSVGGVTIYPMAPWLASQAHAAALASHHHQQRKKH